MSVVEACSMLGDYTHWVYSMGVIHTNHFSTHQISSRNYCVDLCHFYTSYRDHSTALRANFIAARTRSPYWS